MPYGSHHHPPCIFCGPWTVDCGPPMLGGQNITLLPHLSVKNVIPKFLHGKRRPGILLATWGNLIVAQNLVYFRVSFDQRKTKLPTSEQLFRRIGMPETCGCF